MITGVFFCFLFHFFTVLESGSALTRLPRDIVPSHYTLEIVSHLYYNRYDGSVTIQVECKANTNKLILHAQSEDGALKINENDIIVRETSKEDENFFESTQWEPENDFFIIKTNKPLIAGKIYLIHITFNGLISEERKGYYMIIGDGDSSKRVATVQFSNTMARRVFPCFDEPDMRATYTLKLVHKESEQSFALTGPKNRITVNDRLGLVLTEFNKSPVLSTYQISFVVTNLKMVSQSVTNNRKETAFLWRTEHSKYDAESDSKMIPTQLTAFSHFLGLESSMSYKPQKLDFLFFPINDEIIPDPPTKWGLAILTEEETRKTKETNSLSTNKQAASFPLNEILSTQFLETPVSPDWWSSLWLFQSLSTYFAGLIVSQEYSDKQILPILQEWLFKDSFKDGENVFEPLDQLKDIQNNQLELSRRNKGTLLIRMIHLTLGDRIFKNSLQRFFSQYESKSASVDNFWDMLNSFAKGRVGTLTQSPTVQISIRKYRRLSAAKKGLIAIPGYIYRNLKSDILPTGETVKHVMDSWTTQRGYPLVTVNRLRGGIVEVTQKRFLGDLKERLAISEGDDLKCWWIPLTYSTSKKPDFSRTQPQQWLGCDHREAGIVFRTGTDPNDWIIFNNQFTGLYRVQYDTANWELISSTLNDKEKFTTIHVMNRVQLVSDAISISYLGQLSYSITIDLLNYLHWETDLRVFQAFCQNVLQTVLMIERTQLRNQFEEFSRSFLKHIFVKIFPQPADVEKFIDNDLDDVDYDMKSDIFIWSCEFKLQDCLILTETIYNKWKSNGVIPEVYRAYSRTLMMHVICNAVREGDVSNFEFLFNLVKTSNKDDVNFAIYLFGLACVKGEAEIKRVLDWTFSIISAAISPNQRQKIFIYLAGGQRSFKHTLVYFYQNVKKIYARESSPEVIGEYVKALACESSDDELNELSRFVDTDTVLKNLPEVRQAIEKGKEMLETRKKWTEMNYISLNEALAKRKQM